MSYRGESDPAVIAASLSGNPEVFAEIFDRHFERIYAYLRRRFGVEIAAELVSEVFTQAFMSRHTFDERAATAAPWLFGIAANVARRHFRSQARAPMTVPLDESLPVDAGDQASEVDSRLDLESAVARLNDEQREVLLLYTWADLSYEEIAAALGLPIGTVRSRLSRGREALRELLGQDEARTQQNMQPVSSNEGAHRGRA